MAAGTLMAAASVGRHELLMNIAKAFEHQLLSRSRRLTQCLPEGWKYLWALGLYTLPGDLKGINTAGKQKSSAEEEKKMLSKSWLGKFSEPELTFVFVTLDATRLSVQAMLNSHLSLDDGGLLFAIPVGDLSVMLVTPLGERFQPLQKLPHQRERMLKDIVKAFYRDALCFIITSSGKSLPMLNLAFALNW